MITGLHTILYTSRAEDLRALFRDVLGFPCVDAGDGWLIFVLPPAELGVHPASEGDNHHALSFMCDDIKTTVAELESKGLTFQRPNP